MLLVGFSPSSADRPRTTSAPSGFCSAFRAAILDRTKNVAAPPMANKPTAPPTTPMTTPGPPSSSSLAVPGAAVEVSATCEEDDASGAGVPTVTSVTDALADTPKFSSNFWVKAVVKVSVMATLALSSVFTRTILWGGFDTVTVGTTSDSRTFFRDSFNVVVSAAESAIADTAWASSVVMTASNDIVSSLRNSFRRRLVVTSTADSGTFWWSAITATACDSVMSPSKPYPTFT
mmetsp:Transcript_140669/g.244927  ORF Transcript_140669/g.244927 Transcript_140669/m.244927 type:complete len:233 (+) Transcript_140669:358-1056(+)